MSDENDRKTVPHEYLESSSAFGPVCISRIMVATDFSPLSDRAVAFAVSLAAQLDASVCICHVCEPAPATLDATGSVLQAAVTSDDILKAAHAAVQRDIERYSFAGRKLTGIVREGDPVTEIVNIADDAGADLIVMGAHDRGTLSRLFFHSETSGVLGNTSIPVLVVKDVGEASSRAA